MQAANEAGASTFGQAVCKAAFGASQNFFELRLVGWPNDF
jgi:hypothetical protein